MMDSSNRAILRDSYLEGLLSPCGLYATSRHPINFRACGCMMQIPAPASRCGVCKIVDTICFFACEFRDPKAQMDKLHVRAMICLICSQGASILVPLRICRDDQRPVDAEW